MLHIKKNYFVILISLLTIIAMAFAIKYGVSSSVKAETTNYQGQVVIWDYYVANPQSVPTSTKADGKAWGHRYVVLKNISSSPIDVSDWKMYYISDKKTATYIKYNVSSRGTTFAENTVIPAGGYLFYSFGKKITTFPTFVTNSDNLIFQYTNTESGGAKGALLVTQTELSTLDNVEITSLTSDMVDLIGCNNGTNSASCYLGGTIRVNAGYHLLRTGYTGNNTQDYTEQQNYYISDTNNSLSYLYEDISSIENAKQVLDTTELVSIKGTITHYDSANFTYTVQDSTGAMLVTVPNTTDEIAVGRIVKFSGSVDGGAMSVDTDENVVDITQGSVTYESTTIEDILTDSKYDNYAVSLNNVSFDAGLLDDGNGHTIALSGVTPTYTNISIKGIVRVSGTSKTLAVYDVNNCKEYRTFAYNELSNVRDLIEDETMSGVHFSAQGYVTYASGSDAYIEDQYAGIALHGVNIGEQISKGQYVIVDGTINEYNNNIQIDSATLVEVISSPTYTEPEVHAVANSGEISSYMHRGVSIENATVVSKIGNNNNFYKILFGANLEYQAYLDVNMTIDISDNISIKLGVVFNKKYNNSDYLTIKCDNNSNYIEVKTLSIQNILESSEINDNDTVDTKGTITYVDETHNLFILQGGGYGIVVINDSTQTNIQTSTLSAGSVIKLTGVITKSSSYPQIMASSIKSSATDAESAVDGSLNELSSLKLKYVNFGQAKVVSVSSDGKTLSVSNSTGTATVVTTYNKNLHKYDYITLSGVVYTDGTSEVIVSSSELNISSNMAKIQDIYSKAGVKDNDEFIVRGIVTYIEVDTNGNQHGIENLIIEQSQGTARFAIRLYFGNTIMPESNSIAMGDTVTFKGTRKTFNGLIELISVEVLGDIEHGAELDPAEMTIAKINKSDAYSLYQSMYVQLIDVQLKEFVVNANNDVMAVLIQGADANKTLDFYVGQVETDENANDALARIIAQFTEWDVITGDTFDIVGHLNFYQRTIKIDNVNTTVGGFRLELHLDGTNTVSDLTPADYISNQTKTEYTITFKNKDGVAISQYTKTMVRNSEFIAPDAPEIEGSAFVAWISDDGTISYEAGKKYSVMATDVTVKANYDVATFTLHFETGTDETINDISNITYGSKINLPNPEVKKDGYTFGGWYTEETYEHAFTSNTTINSDTTLYARWRKVSDVKKTAPTNTLLVVLISVSSTLVVVSAGIIVVHLIKSKKQTGID